VKAMALHSRKNEYRGVNAHLHSIFQNEEGWQGFHNGHVTDLGRVLSHALPPGYRVDMERSLQIREYHPDTGEKIRRPQPDVTLYHKETAAPHAQRTSAASVVPTLTQPIRAAIERDDDSLYYTALVIYKTAPDNRLGIPVTRIELLSPTNKEGDGYQLYREKRNATLESGLRLVEVDYLHQTPSPVKNIPPYPQHPKAFAYSITVSNPTPTFDEGLSATYGFGVDEAIPAIDVPLLGDDVVIVDFSAVYQRTFEDFATYSQLVDYSELPLRFETYSGVDQERIRGVMARAADATKAQ
jgi:hypothetical protein